MSGIRRYTVTLIVIISTFLNIFISYFHFGHHNHIINPATGNLEHAHECSGENHHHEDEDSSEGSAFKQQISHYSNDTCGLLDILLKQSLKQISYSELTVNYISIPFITFSADFFSPAQNILSFAPKNSPPFS
ncbi:MAG TPA: hypothetical protein VLJ60_04350 [bacterium]|nr:hypothetical protein [bacterium]